MYLTQEYYELKPFSSIIVCNSADWKLSEDEETKILVEMSEYLHSFGAKLFRLQGNDFALIYDSKDEHEMDEIESAVNLDVMRHRFKTPWGDEFLTNTKFLYIPDGHIATSFDEYMDIYSRYKDTFTNAEDMKTLDDQAGQSIREYRQMVLEIKDALSTDRVEVFYQPIYSISTDKFVSAEALARIRGKDGKMIMPGKFIPVAEETGLIEQIGERVFEKTCKCITEDKLKEKGVDYVEVNLSVSQCENPLLSTKYDDIMKKLGVTPSEVNLEITESSTLNQRGILLDNMNKLMNLGCNFSLDDFGTGESNLNYIMDMPVKIVKFDRSMVQEYFSNEKARVVITATVNMIKQLGLQTVAEGVETADQFEEIKQLGIDYIQGFYFSKPLPKSDFITFLNEKNSL
jgi:EAL domain-containing protein (putative c-di-GMP-specific phosphodiesterase class I)